MFRRVLIGFGLVVVAALGFVGYQGYRLLHSETVKIDDRFLRVRTSSGSRATYVRWCHKWRSK
jgi:hypothetical protein